MLLYHHISPYLVASPPPPSQRHGRRLRILKAGLPVVSRTHRIKLSAWMIAVAVVTAGLQASPLLSPVGTFGEARRPAVKTATASLATATTVTLLPSGPSGQILPPGTMAAPYAFKNTYASGQCTWYVAGRRQVPSGWGNANTWYYRARSQGWSTGTVPAVGAIATTTQGYFGHTALVEAIEGSQILVSEMNFIGPYVIDRRWVPATGFKYIY